MLSLLQKKTQKSPDDTASKSSPLQKATKEEDKAKMYPPFASGARTQYAPIDGLLQYVHVST